MPVLGIGNSATDIAAETSRVSQMTYLAMRRGAYMIPKFMARRVFSRRGDPFVTRITQRV